MIPPWNNLEIIGYAEGHASVIIDERGISDLSEVSELDFRIYEINH